MTSNRRLLRVKENKQPIPSLDSKVDDGTGSPWTVVNASKNPTSLRWLKDDNGVFLADAKFYVLVMAEPIVLRDSKARVQLFTKAGWLKAEFLEHF